MYNIAFGNYRKCATEIANSRPRQAALHQNEWAPWRGGQGMKEAALSDVQDESETPWKS